VQRKLRFCFAVVTFAGASAVSVSPAQTLDKTRIVYRCEHQGKVTYSDEPCVGARQVDVTPTQGLDMSSGVSRKGADVQHAEHRKRMAEALKPLTGLDAKGLEQSGRRMQLTAEVQQACRQLDQKLPDLTSAEAQAVTKLAKAEAEVRLFRARKAFKDLRC